MSLLKYLNRFERMHLLIKRKSTGDCEEFADKMNMSRSQLLQCISDMRDFGAPIKFCFNRKCYVYEYSWDPFISNKMSKEELIEVGGRGRNILNQIDSVTQNFINIFLKSDITGHLHNSLVP